MRNTCTVLVRLCRQQPPPSQANARTPRRDTGLVLRKGPSLGTAVRMGAEAGNTSRSKGEQLGSMCSDGGGILPGEDWAVRLDPRGTCWRHGVLSVSRQRSTEGTGALTSGRKRTGRPRGNSNGATAAGPRLAQLGQVWPALRRAARVPGPGCVVDRALKLGAVPSHLPTPTAMASLQGPRRRLRAS
eukprot:scaffold382_cov380-Prasinococcus_capsulatus_cf.AAC.40